MNKPTHEKIYLVPEDGIYCWSTTPAPGAQHESNDAVEYVRGDLFEALKAERDAVAARIQTAERVEKIFSETPELTFDDCLKQFADEIRNIQAEAGRAGYYEGFRAGIVIDAPLLPPQSGVSAIDHFRRVVDHVSRVNADNYAAKVRQGGAE